MKGNRRISITAAISLAGAFLLKLSAFSAQEAAQSSTPWWLGSKAGVSREVLPPWTPVEVSSTTVKVWGRSYEFNTLPLPDMVTTRDAEVLAAPITLQGSADGKELVWNGAGCQVVEAQPAAVRLRAEAVSGNLRCAGDVTVEYDGMVRCDLQFLPTAGKATLERLWLEMPLKEQYARYLHFWPGKWGIIINSIALPQDGYRGPFRPFFWLGDEQCGLGWFCESERNFFNPPEANVIEIERRDGEVVFRVNLITLPQTIEKPLAYTFGFQATPVKPLTPDAWDYRTFHITSEYGYGIETKLYTPPGMEPMPLLDYLARSGVRTLCFHEHWTDIQAYPATTHEKELKKLVEACHRQKISLLLYLGYEMSTLAPEWPQWSEKCLVAPRAGGYKRTYQPQLDQTAYIVCYRSPWQDFLAAHLEKLVKDFDIDGVYLDSATFAWGCVNTTHGCGYKRPDGSTGLTYPIFAVRSMIKRLYTIIHRHNPNGQLNIHQSTCMVIPPLSFATSYWDGEHLQNIKRPDRLLEVLPLESFRCEFMGRNWGLPAELLHYDSGPLKRSEAMALAMLHDVPVRPLRPAEVKEMSLLWQAFDAFGRHEAQWLPYWDNSDYAKCNPDDVKVSIYNRPSRGFLAVIVNTGQEQCQAKVAFDLETLKQSSNLAVSNVLTKEDLPFAQGRLTLTLEPLGFIVLQATPH